MKVGKLELAVFAVGVGVLVVEIGGARLLSSYLGNTLFSWTSSISVVLASLALGYYLGGKMADKKPDMKRLSLFLFCAGLFVAIIPFISQATLEFSLRFGFEFGPLVASTILFALPNALLGVVSPYAVRIKTKMVRVVGENAGNLYAISTIGSIVGALLSGYVLIPFLGVSETFFLAGFLLVAAGAMILGVKGVPMVAAVFVLFWFPPSLTYHVGNSTLLYQTDTPYYHLEVVNSSGTLLLKTEFLGTQTIAYANYSSPAGLAYYGYPAVAYYGPDKVRNVLFLGLGGGAMVNVLYRDTSASADVVEIDPIVIKVAEKYYNISSNDRVRIYNQDARFFLRNSTKKYDLIVLDTYDQSFSLPYYLVTIEAINEMKTHLNPNGSVFINLISPLVGDHSSSFRALYKTLSSAFPNVYVFSFAELGNQAALTKVRNVELLASENKTRHSKDYITSELKGKIDNATYDEILSTYYNATVNTTGYPVLTDDKNPTEYYFATMMAQVAPKRT